MTIAARLLDSGTGSAVSSKATASVTPVGGRLLVLAVASYAAAAVPNTPTVSGDGYTWGTSTVKTAAGSTHIKLTVFRDVLVAPSAGALTIDFAAQSQTGIAYSLVEYSGSANAVDGIVTNDGAGTSLSITPGTQDGTDATYAAFMNDDALNGALSPGAGFVTIHEINSIIPGLLAEWATGVVSPIATGANAANWIGIGFGIKIATDPTKYGSFRGDHHGSHARGR